MQNVRRRCGAEGVPEGAVPCDEVGRGVVRGRADLSGPVLPRVRPAERVEVPELCRFFHSAVRRHVHRSDQAAHPQLGALSGVPRVREPLRAVLPAAIAARDRAVHQAGLLLRAELRLSVVSRSAFHAIALEGGLVHVAAHHFAGDRAQRRSLLRGHASQSQNHPAEACRACRAREGPEQAGCGRERSRDPGKRFESGRSADLCRSCRSCRSYETDDPCGRGRIVLGAWAGRRKRGERGGSIAHRVPSRDLHGVQAQLPAPVRTIRREASLQSQAAVWCAPNGFVACLTEQTTDKKAITTNQSF